MIQYIIYTVYIYHTYIGSRTWPPLHLARCSCCYAPGWYLARVRLPGEEKNWKKQHEKITVAMALFAILNMFRDTVRTGVLYRLQYIRVLRNHFPYHCTVLY